MARKKENKPMTRQVRIYEADAKIIDFVLFMMNKGDKKKTFADIVGAALRSYYRDEANRVEELRDGNEYETVTSDSGNAKRRNG